LFSAFCGRNGVAGEDDFPIALGCLTGLVNESLAGRDVIKRHGLKRREQSKGVAFANAAERVLYFVKRMLTGAKVGPDIEGVDF
jgi:hypothetical protein